MWIRIPRHTPDKRDLCHVIQHEMGHIKGMYHRDMPKSRYRRVPGYKDRYPYADAFPLEKKPKSVKFKPTADTKLVHAKTMLDKASTRLRRAKTIQKKWSMKVRYYERKLAAQSTKAEISCKP